MKNKIISLAITLIIIMQFLLPIVSHAASTITITAVQDTTNLHNVTVTIADDSANITEFKYVNKNIQLDDIDYFNTGSDVVSVDITESKNISKVLTLEYGEYTF